MKIYDRADEDTFQRVARLVKAHHPEIEKAGITVDVLMVQHDEPDNQDPAISHHGYAALATVRAVPVTDRAGGRKDVEILVDFRRYKQMAPGRRDALLDHELTHLQPVTGKDQAPKLDGAGRPRVKLRKHDRQIGWFDVCVRRWGEDSHEKQQAREFLQEAGQLYFDLPGGGAGVSVVKAAVNS